MKIDLNGDIPWYEILGIISFAVNVIQVCKWLIKSYLIDSYLSGIWQGDLLYTDIELQDLKLKCTIIFVEYSNSSSEGYLYYQKINVRTNAIIERGLDKLHQVQGRIFFDRKLQINFMREFSIDDDIETNNIRFLFDCKIINVVAKPKMYVKYKLHNGTFAEGEWTKN